MPTSDENPTQQYQQLPPPPPAPPAAYGYPQPPQQKRRNLALPIGLAAAVTGAVLGGAVAAPVT